MANVSWMRPGRCRHSHRSCIGCRTLPTIYCRRQGHNRPCTSINCAKWHATLGYTMAIWSGYPLVAIHVQKVRFMPKSGRIHEPQAWPFTTRITNQGAYVVDCVRTRTTHTPLVTCMSSCFRRCWLVVSEDSYKLACIGIAVAD